MSILYDHQEPLLNFSDILISYRFRDGEVCRHTMNDHALIHVCSGILTIKNNGKTTKVYAGETAFLARNYKLEMSVCSSNGAEFNGVFLVFSRKFLMRYYHQMNKDKLPSAQDKRMPSIVKLNSDLHISTLFQALNTFIQRKQTPTPQYMELKQVEGTERLIEQNNRFCINLFDFVGDWKVDILDFLENNYTDELTLAEIALFTGRSLAALKRDFAKVSNLSPQRWLTKRRLHDAYKLIAEDKSSPKSFYLRLGFKSLSHFSTAFKNEFGITPSELLNKVH